MTTSSDLLSIPPAELVERYLRIAADLQNVRRQTRTEIERTVEASEDAVLTEIICLLEDLERAEKAVLEEHELKKGIRLVVRNGLAALARYNVTPVLPTLGHQFDPNVAEALNRLPSTAPPNQVIEEVRRGYMRGPRLLRPAHVIVSAGMS